MAINFGDTVMEGGIEPAARVQQPVEDNSGAVLASALAPAAKAIGEVAGGIFKANEDSRKASILVKYENDLLDLADAVDQGQLDRSGAMTRARVLRKKYLSDAPALQADFDKVWGNIVSSNGLGHVISTGTIENQAYENLVQDSIKAGYPSVESYQEFLTQANTLKNLNTQWDQIKARGGIITDTMKTQGIQAIAGLATTAYPAAQKQINDAMAAIEANPSQRAEIVNSTLTALGQSIAQLDSLGLGADTKYVTDPIRNLLDTFNKWGTGEIENSVLDNQLKFTQLQYNTIFNADPVLGPFIAQSALLKEVGLNDTVIAGQLLTPEVIKHLRDATTPGQHVNILTNNESSQRFVQEFTKAVDLVSNDPAAIEEAKQAIAGIVDGSYVNERAAADGALGWKGLVEVLGSPEMENFVRENGEIPSQYNVAVSDALTRYYEAELLPAIQRYWESVPVQDPTAGEQVGVNNLPMNQILDATWNGSVVQFAPKPEYANNPRIVALAEDVNSGNNSIGYPLNTLLRAQALLTKSDPKNIWEQNIGPTLGMVTNEDASVADRTNAMLDRSNRQSDAEPQFTLGDFNQETLEPLEEFVNQGSGVSADLPPIDPAYTDIEGIDYSSYLPSIRAAESGGNDSAKNPLSTATGRYQFLRSTWNGLVNKYPNSGLTYDGRLNPQQQEVAIRLFTAENARALQRGGISLSNGTLYAAHFLGATDAVRVLNSPPSTLVSQIVSPKVVQANPFLRGWTVSQFRSWTNRKGNG